MRYPMLASRQNLAEFMAIGYEIREELRSQLGIRDDAHLNWVVLAIENYGDNGHIWAGRLVDIAFEANHVVSCGRPERRRAD
ncbi:hypothetical protein ACTJKX_35355 [Labrys sp. 22185]